jgi:transcriptional regulator with XRE-family HTH domain
VLIGGKIKRLRLERGLTQEDAAYAAGLAVSTLQRLEADEYQPRLSTLRALAKVLDVPAGQLIDFE